MNLHICENKIAMGRAAARCGAQQIRDAVARKRKAVIVVATAPSQNEMYDALVREEVPWGKVEIFHLDEYIGLLPNHPASFRFNLNKSFLSRLPEAPLCFHPVRAEGKDPVAVCDELGKLLRGMELDVAFIGIGENGHIAFNDPPADFHSPNAYNPVKLDEVCRNQQFKEGWFPTMDAVPKAAISMSVPQIFRAKFIVNTVPDLRKAEAVRNAVLGPVTPNCPASILQTHPACELFLDREAASLLEARDAK
ncbi:MAG: glucosamine-6-phosphate deaminase [Victivallaceae bacterium]|nr:glucosamine-6-phosphate deaminase [Victivallaceae bacterium]